MISIWTDALRIFSIALFVLIMFLAAYHFRNRWLAHRYKDINATSILAKIFAVREFNGRKRGALRLTASGRTRRTTPVSLSVYTAMAESIIDQITFANIIPLCRAGDGNSPCEH